MVEAIKVIDPNVFDMDLLFDDDSISHGEEVDEGKYPEVYAFQKEAVDGMTEAAEEKDTKVTISSTNPVYSLDKTHFLVLVHVLQEDKTSTVNVFKYKIKKEE